MNALHQFGWTVLEGAAVDRVLATRPGPPPCLLICMALAVKEMISAATGGKDAWMH